MLTAVTKFRNTVVEIEMAPLRGTARRSGRNLPRRFPFPDVVTTFPLKKVSDSLPREINFN